MENKLEKLIGAQLVSLDDNSMVLNLKGENYTIDISRNNGDCCGYTDVESTLYYSPNSNYNPIITDIKLRSHNGTYDGETVIITLYGENKELASIEASAGSGSGWTYGACVWLECDKLEIDEILASW